MKMELVEMVFKRRRELSNVLQSGTVIIGRKFDHASCVLALGSGLRKRWQSRAPSYRCINLCQMMTLDHIGGFILRYLIEESCFLTLVFLYFSFAAELLANHYTRTVKEASKQTWTLDLKGWTSHPPEILRSSLSLEAVFGLSHAWRWQKTGYQNRELWQRIWDQMKPVITLLLAWLQLSA